MILSTRASSPMRLTQGLQLWRYAKSSTPCDDSRSLTPCSSQVKFKGGVVLGADSRTSTGSYIANRVSDKLTFVHDRIYCCRSGSAADTQVLSPHRIVT